VPRVLKLTLDMGIASDRFHLARKEFAVVIGDGLCAIACPSCALSLGWTFQNHQQHALNIGVLSTLAATTVPDQRSRTVH